VSVVTVATFFVTAEHRAEVVAAIEEAIARVHEEPGCELYALHEGADRLVMIEKWRDPEVVQAHAKGAAFADLFAKIKDKLNGELDIQVLEPHPAGTPEQGQL
jgi:quinol monooxygenase YgiN